MRAGLLYYLFLQVIITSKADEFIIRKRKTFLHPVVMTMPKAEVFRDLVDSGIESRINVGALMNG